MNDAPTDLYLGSDLGLWALQQVDPRDIRYVFTLDDAIASTARALGIEAITVNANLANPSPCRTGFSVHYPRLLREPLLAKYNVVYNLHPGYLPWGRGYYPVFWALYENTCAGCTLHEITVGIDEGPLVDQVLVEHGPQDTGDSLFKRVRVAEKALFLKHWPSIRRGVRLPTRTQARGGSYHAKRDFLELKACPNWEALSGAELVRLIRCLTITQYTGFELTLGQQRFEMILRPLPSAAQAPIDAGACAVPSSGQLLPGS